MRRGLRTLLAGAVLGGTLAAASGAASGMPDIVGRAIAFHGGAGFTASTTSFEVCSKSGCSRVVVTRGGGRYRYEVEADVRDGRRRVVASNETVSAWLDGRPQEVGDSARAQALRDWAMQRVYFNFLPFRLGDPSVVIRDLGLEKWQGRSLHKVAVGFEAGSSTDADDEYRYWFDPETARLELFAYSYTVNGGGLRFRRLFNYRRVGGLLFYDQENWGVEGPGLSVDMVTPGFVAERMRRVSTITLERIRVDPLPP